MPRRIREYLATASLFVASVVIAILTFEGLLRVFPSLLPEAVQIRLHWIAEGAESHSPHSYIGFVPRPGHFGPDEDALKATAEEIWAHRNLTPWAEQADVVVVGDSFSYSQTADLSRAWTTLLDENTPNTRVVTLGMIGAAPQQYLRVLEQYGLRLSPKVAIVGVFLGNDLRDAEVFDDWWEGARDEDFRAFRHEANSLQAGGWSARIARSSYIGQVLKELRLAYKEGRLFDGETIELASGERVQLVPRFLVQNANDARQGQRGFDLVMETLSEIDDFAESHGFKSLVVLFPRKEEVYGQFTEQELPNTAEAAIAVLDGLGISYLDLGPVFRERALGERALYWEVDGHPTPLGYALVAETLEAHLRQFRGELGLDWDAVSPVDNGSDVRSD